MKTLSFTVNGQKLSKKPSILFSRLVAGSSNFYDVSFEFSPEWSSLIKVVKFASGSIEEYIPLTNNTCKIPERISKLHKFNVSIVGATDDVQIMTNTITITQKGGI